tara:strand:+ start:230 stop:604 length:375 start_codon:yes stop_codon:yes gene_type:complete
MTFKKFKNINYPVPGLDTAIQILRPGAKYELSSSADVNFIQWIDEENREPPTSEEIGIEILREKKIYDYYKYEREREKQYPDLKEQLDNLYHDIKNNNLIDGEWIKSIDKVKLDNPKPNTPPPK